MCKCPEPKTEKIFSAPYRSLAPSMYFGGAPVRARRRMLSIQIRRRIPSP